MKDLFRRKPLDSLLRDKGGDSVRRSLGAFDVTLLGIGVTIGTGIFVLTGHVAATNAGPAVALSFIIAAVAAALAGLCYAEMASMIPVAGSAYTYAYTTVGEIFAFVIGWTLVLEYLLGAAVVTVGWSGYLGAFIQRLTGSPLPTEWTSAPVTWNEATKHFEATGNIVNLPAVLLAFAVTGILIRGARESARVNAIMVAIKLAAIAVFLGSAVSFIRRENWEPFIPPNTGVFGQFGNSGVLQGATMVFLAYVGFDAISSVTHETRNPQRDIPIGMLGSLACCTVLYVAVALVLTGVVPYTTLSVPHPLAMGIAVTGKPWLETLVGAGALAGLTSGAVVMLMGQTRIFYAMARDGLFPPIAARLHPRFGTPHVTTIVTGCLCALTGGLLPIQVLGELTSIGTLFAFVLVSISVTILRLRRPEVPRAFRVPGGPWIVPMLSAAVSGGLMLTSTSTSLIRLFGWMAIGLVVYASYGRRHSKLALQENAEPVGGTAPAPTPAAEPAE